MIKKFNEFENISEDNKDAVHLRHCNQGEYEGSCKYGEPNCPACDDLPDLTDYSPSMVNPDVVDIDGVEYRKEKVISIRDTKPADSYDGNLILIKNGETFLLKPLYD